MYKIEITERELNAVVQALRVAAVQYVTDAEHTKGSDLPDPGKSHLVRQFQDQSQFATSLADRLDDSEEAL